MFGLWQAKTKTCKCRKSFRYSKTAKTCVLRRCKKTGERWSKKHNRCRCNKKKGFKRFTKGGKCRRCPQKFRWNKKTKECVRKCPFKGYRFSKKHNKCIPKCRKHQRYSAKKGKCVCRKGRVMDKRNKKCHKPCGAGTRWNTFKAKCVCVGRHQTLVGGKCQCKPGFPQGKGGKCYKPCPAPNQHFSVKQEKCVLNRCQEENSVWSKEQKLCVCKEGFFLYEDVVCKPIPAAAARALPH